MAFGNSLGGRNYGPNAKLFYFKLKTKDLPEPVFEVKTKVGDKLEEVKTAVPTKAVEGDLVDIANKEFKYDKKTIKSVTVTLHDNSEGKNEWYFVGVPHTYLGRNILNSLLGLKTYGGVQIAVYKGKPKPDKADPTKMKEGFHSSAIRQGGELVYGKFKNEELPKIPKVKVGSELFSDTTEIEAFFIAQVAEMSKVVKAAAPKVAAATSGSGDGDAGAEDTGADDLVGVEGAGPDDKLPF